MRSRRGRLDSHISDNKVIKIVASQKGEKKEEHRKSQVRIKGKPIWERTRRWEGMERLNAGENFSPTLAKSYGQEGTSATTSWCV